MSEERVFAVVKFCVRPDEVHVLLELLERRDLAVVDSLLNFLKRHRTFNDVEIIWGAVALWVDELYEGRADGPGDQLVDDLKALCLLEQHNRYL